MMLRPRNLLVLDEPTNHLDIPAREVLEEALDDYEGTVLVVSHDRYFLDRVVTKILHLHDGRAEQHVGNYSDCKAARAKRRKPAARRREEARRRSAEPPKRRSKRSASRSASRRRRASASSSKKQKRLEELEEKIAGAESEIAALNDKLAGRSRRRLAEAARRWSPTRRRSSAGCKSWMGEWEKLGDELRKLIQWQPGDDHPRRRRTLAPETVKLNVDEVRDSIARAQRKQAALVVLQGSESDIGTHVHARQAGHHRARSASRAAAAGRRHLAPPLPRRARRGQALFFIEDLRLDQRHAAQRRARSQASKQLEAGDRIYLGALRRQVHLLRRARGRLPRADGRARRHRRSHRAHRQAPLRRRLRARRRRGARACARRWRC